MLRWTLIFFVFSVFAALLGFSGIAATASGFAQILFYIFLALFVLSLLMRLVTGTDKLISKNL